MYVVRVCLLCFFILFAVTVAASAADVVAVDFAFVVPEASFGRYQIQFQDTFSIRCNAR